MTSTNQNVIRLSVVRLREYIYLPAERRNSKDNHELNVSGQLLNRRLFFILRLVTKNDVDIKLLEKTISVAATEIHRRYSMGVSLSLVNEYCPHKSNKERMKNNGNQTNICAITQGQSAGEEPLLQLLRRKLSASGRRRHSRLCADQFVQQYHVQLLCEMRAAQ